MFILYTQPLSNVISSHACSYHKYADDTKLSDSAPPCDFSFVQSNVQQCILDVLSWMTSNKLKLNTDKTEAMPAGIPSNLSSLDCNHITIDGTDIPFKSCVKYLGVKIDQSLSMQEQISSVCRAAFFELRRIASIRRYLSESACATLVCSLVTSRLDFCNSVLAGLPNEQLGRLQRVQNSAARLILRKRKRDSATPLLMELHWLPVKYRCMFKLATLSYRHFDGSLPAYLSNVLVTYQPSRSLRSSNEKLLKIPQLNLKTVGERSFRFLAPSIWNSLPCDLRNASTLSEFKANLKTYLFRSAFA